MKTLLFLTISLLSLHSFSGSYFHHENLGFSKDNKYYAFTQFGEHDGAGHADAWTWVVDVKKNKLIKVGQCDCDEMNQVKTIEEAKEESKLKANLKRYGFTKDKIIGQTMLKRLPTDLNSSNKLDFRAIKYPDAPNFGQIFNLKLTQTSLGTNCYDLATPTLLKVELGKNEKFKVLQDDISLPRARKCAYGYKVAEIVYEKDSDSLAIIISYKTPGFEGADTLYLVVTTKLDKLPY